MYRMLLPCHCPVILDPSGGRRILSPTCLRIGALLSSLLIAALSLAACSGGDQSGKGIVVGGSNKPAYNGVLIDPALKKPDAILTDASGKPFDLRKQTEGSTTLLYVGYTHCPDVCPTHMAEIAAALKQLGPSVRDKVKVVFVTSDPERDTPSVLKSWLGAFDPSFIGLTGDEAAIRSVTDQIGMGTPEKEDLGGGNYGVSHGAFVMLFTTDDLAHVVYPSGMQVSDWVHDLPLLVNDGWRAA